MEKRQYVPNPARLDAVTTQKVDFVPILDVKPPKRKEQPKWVSTTGAFDSATTSKTDYVTFPIPPAFVRKIQPYVKSKDKMDTVSTQKSDYLAWGKESMPPRRKVKQVAATQDEDR
jgi:hypothetical protein